MEQSARLISNNRTQTHKHTNTTISHCTMAAEQDTWVFPYSQKYKGYIVDATSFIDFLAKRNSSNKSINSKDKDNNNLAEQVCNEQQIFVYIQEQLDIINANQQADRAWMEEQFNMLRANHQHNPVSFHPARLGQGQRQRWEAQAAEEAAAAAAAAAAVKLGQAGDVFQGQAGTFHHPIQCIDPRACLMDRPNSLHDLWTEYMFGYDGNKPAKGFTVAERNNRTNGIKQKYYNRSRVWRLQVYLLNAGMAVKHANELMVNTYGHSMVSRIIKGIIRDANNPHYQLIPAVGFRVHPNLVVG